MQRPLFDMLKGLLLSLSDYRHLCASVPLANGQSAGACKFPHEFGCMLEFPDQCSPT